MPAVERFIEGVVADFLRRLALLGDGGDRRALEDGIALLTDYRLSEMDETALERVIAMLRSGRSPVGMLVLKPEAIGGELARRWRAYAAERVTAAAGT